MSSPIPREHVKLKRKSALKQAADQNITWKFGKYLQYCMFILYTRKYSSDLTVITLSDDRTVVVAILFVCLDIFFKENRYVLYRFFGAQLMLYKYVLLSI